VRYRLRYAREAERAVRNAPGTYRQRFRRAIEGLADNPRPAVAEPMREPEYYKIPFDKWRLIHLVREELGEVWILRVKIKSGPEAYQGLETPGG
jgi:mRNA-degrading endonuclease RelE of RelBE toxin-antitoxin system